MSNACFFLSLIKLIKGDGRHEKHHSAKSWWRSTDETLSFTCSTSRKVIKQQREEVSKNKKAQHGESFSQMHLKLIKYIILIAISRLVNWSVKQHTEDKKKNLFLWVYWKKGLFKLKMLSLHQVCPVFKLGACAPSPLLWFSERPAERLYCPLVEKKYAIDPVRQLYKQTLFNKSQHEYSMHGCIKHMMFKGTVKKKRV